MHWLIVSVRSDWHEATSLSSAELARKIGDVVFTGKAGFGVPKVLLVEDDIDTTDINDVVWAFATRTHPEHGEVHFPALPHVQLSVYLSEAEAHSYRAGKVLYNCLLADLFTEENRPVKGSFANGWPADVQQRVLAKWETYGYRSRARRTRAGCLKILIAVRLRAARFGSAGHRLRPTAPKRSAG